MVVNQGFGAFRLPRKPEITLMPIGKRLSSPAKISPRIVRKGIMRPRGILPPVRAHFTGFGRFSIGRAVASVAKAVVAAPKAVIQVAVAAPKAIMANPLVLMSPTAMAAVATSSVAKNAGVGGSVPDLINATTPQSALSIENPDLQKKVLLGYGAAAVIGGGVALAATAGTAGTATAAVTTGTGLTEMGAGIGTVGAGAVTTGASVGSIVGGAGLLTTAAGYLATAQKVKSAVTVGQNLFASKSGQPNVTANQAPQSTEATPESDNTGLMLIAAGIAAKVLLFS